MKNENVKNNNSIVPNALSMSRILFVLPILVLLKQEKTHFALCLFLISAISDYLDGYCARKLKLENSWGWLIDSGADFILLISLFGYYCSIGYVSIILLILIISSFLSFMCSGFLKTYPYDSFGKYIGLFCYVFIGIMMTFPIPLVIQICDWLLGMILVLSLLDKFRGWIQISDGSSGSVPMRR